MGIKKSWVAKGDDVRSLLLLLLLNLGGLRLDLAYMISLVRLLAQK